MKNSSDSKITMPAGNTLDRIPFEADEFFEMCPDCDAADGSLHNAGCDGELCPACGKQFVVCMTPGVGCGREGRINRAQLN